MTTDEPALSIDDLSVSYVTRQGPREVLKSVSLNVARGEAYGLVGESGCGKSTLALSVVRYLPANARVTGGIRIEDRDVWSLDPIGLRQLRASRLAMIYQDPSRALNPGMRVGDQIAEIFQPRAARTAARGLALAMLQRVRLEPSVYDRYPHQLSGGMQQRVIIAMALSIEPRVLILDEPTTGLDATVAAEVLELLSSLRRASGLSLLFISHDLGVVARVCDRVGVLYAGQLIEEGATAEVLREPRHPYTVSLLRSAPDTGRRKDHGRLDTVPGSPPTAGNFGPGCRFAPRCGLAADLCVQREPPLFEFGSRRSRCHFHEQAPRTPRFTPADSPGPAAVDRSRAPVLRAVNISKTYPGAHQPIPVLRDVSLDLWPGETLGLVGESGSGKTTLARILAGLARPDSGGTELEGVTLAAVSRLRRPAELGSLQIIFQNPDSALNRAHRVQRLVGRVLDRFARMPREARRTRVLELIRAVRLNEADLACRTRELSGGMKQRTAIARAFAANPAVVVCDEPTSALDVSVQAAVLNLLVDLQTSRGVSYLYISHDLGTVRYLSDRIAVLYRGRLMEVGPAERIFDGPHHPYTAVLVRAASGKVTGVSEDSRTTRGCVFHPRCPRKLGAVCEEREPELEPGIDPGHLVRCHIPAADLASVGR